MKGDIGMANYEKRVEQEAAYPIPISLYNCYRTVRHEKHYQEYIAMPLFSCLTVLYITVVQRHRDGVCSLLFHSSFIVRPEIFTRDVGLEKNDRLGTMHTSDHRRSVWYKN